MNEQEARNLSTFVATALAHQIAIAASLSLAARAHPNGKELLDAFERDLLASSIWQLGNSGAPAEIGERYRGEISAIFSRARSNAGIS